MKIDFYTDTPVPAPTVENYLFTDYLAQIMVGQRHEFCGKLYQVNLLENDDQTGYLKNAYVWQFPALATRNTDTTETDNLPDHE